MTTIKECKGCTILRHVLEHDRLNCRMVAVALLLNKESINCPCHNCLVKVICNDYCMEWVTHRNKWSASVDGVLKDEVNISIRRKHIIIEGDNVKYDRH